MSEKYDKLKSKNQNQKRKIEDLETKIIILEQQCEEYENQLAIKQIKNQNLQIQINEMKENEELLLNKIENLSKERDEFEDEYKQIQIKYKELQMRQNNNNNDGNGFEMRHHSEWNCSDVSQWICALENGRYNKYESRLSVTIKDENITGRLLMDLDKNDLHRLGITAFADKLNVLKHIKSLSKSEMQLEGNVDSTALM